MNINMNVCHWPWLTNFGRFWIWYFHYLFKRNQKRIFLKRRIPSIHSIQELSWKRCYDAVILTATTTHIHANSRLFMKFLAHLNHFGIFYVQGKTNTFSFIWFEMLKNKGKCTKHIHTQKMPNINKPFI